MNRVFSLLVLSFVAITTANLDMAGVKAIYQEGDLDAVRDRLEIFLRKNGESATREERIFAYKYLGVIYAAQAVARSRAEAYFNQALDLSPDLGLAEMYASKEIEALFQETKKTHEAKKRELKNVDEFGNPVADPKPPLSAGNKSRAWIWWIAGGTAVGAGIATYLLIQVEQPNPVIDNVNAE